MLRYDHTLLRRLSAHILRLVGICALGGCVPRAALRAQMLLDHGDYAAADRAIADGLRRTPDDLTWRALKLRALVAQDDRAAAVAACRQRPDPSLRLSLAESVLWWGLRHPDPRVRLDALQRVRAVDAAPLESEVARRLDDPDELVRTWAAVALSATAPGADALERQLRSPDPRARAVAVRELGRIAKDAALATITRFARDPKPEVRAACADALAFTGEIAAQTPLRKLAADSDRDVRVAAVRALGQIGHAEQSGTTQRALKDPYLGVRLAAVRSIRVASRESAQDLLAPLAASAEPLVALAAGVELSRIGPVQPALNAIARGLVDRRPSIRTAAVTAAIAVRDRVAKSLARRALTDAQPAVRLAAARALIDYERSAALRVARSVHALACPADTPPRDVDATTIPLCIEAADLLALAEEGKGYATLSWLARKAKAPAHRRDALRWAALRGSVSEVALAALADPDPSTSLFAAAQLYRELH